MKYFYNDLLLKIPLYFPCESLWGQAIPAVTCVENVSRSLGCTKSMKDLPSHISFGNPREAVRLGVV